MKKAFANSILLIFKPAIFPLLAIVFLFNSNTYLSLYNYAFQLRIDFIIFLITFLFPATFIPLLFGLGIFKSLKLNTKQDNLIMISILLISNIFTLFLIKKIPVFIDKIIPEVFVASSELLAIALILTFFTKICYHSFAIGSFAGFVAYLSIYFSNDYIILLTSVFLIAGFIGFSKINLEKNSQIQIYYSFAIGLLSCLSIFLFF